MWSNTSLKENGELYMRENLSAEKYGATISPSYSPSDMSTLMNALIPVS